MSTWLEILIRNNPKKGTIHLQGRRERRIEKEQAVSLLFRRAMSSEWLLGGYLKLEGAD